MYTVKAGTGVSRSANGELTVDMGQILRNMTGVEQDQEKKSLIQQLIEPKEVDDSERDAKKAMQIARRIARGENVTPQEKAFLMRIDPRLAQMAELARQQGERVQHALENAQSKEEQQTIITQAYQQVAEFTKANPQFGELVGEAIKSAIQKAKEHGLQKPEMEQPARLAQEPVVDAQGAKRPQAETEAQSRQERQEQPDQQEKLLDQFFPEEWVSMLDCQG